MTKRLIGYNPDTGVADYWLETADGWAIETVQETDGLFDLNAEARNHCDPYNAARDTRMVARIPVAFITKMRNEMGVDYYSLDPDEQKVVNRILNDRDYYKLRTDESVL